MGMFGWMASIFNITLVKRLYVGLVCWRKMLLRRAILSCRSWWRVDVIRINRCLFVGVKRMKKR